MIVTNAEESGSPVIGTALNSARAGEVVHVVLNERGIRYVLDRLDAEDEPRHCGACGAVCDFRVHVCECGPDCPLPPVV